MISPRRINLWKRGYDAFINNEPYQTARPLAWRNGWLDAEQQALEWWRRDMDYQEQQRELEIQQHEENPYE